MLVNIHKHKIFFLGALLSGSTVLQAQVWSLQECIDTAMLHNRSLEMGSNNIAISSEKLREVRAGYLPRASVNADYRYFLELPYQLMPMSVFGGEEGKFRETQFGVPHNINANMQLTVPLMNPVLRSQVRTAEIGTELTRLQYSKTWEQVYFEVAGLYYNGQVIRSQLQFVEKNLLNGRKLLETMQLLKKHLMANGTDVDKIALQVQQLVTQKAILESQYLSVVNALKFTLGISLDRVVEVDSIIPYHPLEEYDVKPAIEIRVAQKQNQFLHEELRTLKRSNKPYVSMIASLGTTGFGYDKSPNEFLKFYPTGFTGIQMTVPLFNGTVVKRKVRQKSLEIVNSSIQIEQLADQNRMQRINAFGQRAVALHSIETTLSQNKLAESIYHQTVLQQKEGVATITDILAADNALRESQQKYISALVDYLRADLELKKSSGNLSTIEEK